MANNPNVPDTGRMQNIPGGDDRQIRHNYDQDPRIKEQKVEDEKALKAATRLSGPQGNESQRRENDVGVRRESTNR